MIINAATLKEVLEKIPGEYEVWYDNVPVTDKVEIDVSEKKIILKSQ